MGGLLALQRPAWDFHDAPLTQNGRSALWFITEGNEEVQSINVAKNDVGYDDVGGLTKMLATCPKLFTLDLSQNDLHKLVVEQRPALFLLGHGAPVDIDIDALRLGYFSLHHVPPHLWPSALWDI